MYSLLKDTVAKMMAPGEMFEVEEVEVKGQQLKAWVNAPGSLRDIWLSTREHAHRDYLVYNDERWTYAEAHEEVARIANWLNSQGIGQGDRVAIAMRNYPEWMLCYWAIASIGAVSVGVNAWWVAEELEFGLRDSETKLLICDIERLNRFSEIREDFPELPVVLVRAPEGAETPGWALPWNQVLEADAVLPDAVIDPEQDACIFYTSGTTGVPKGAQLTHRGCVNNIVTVVFVNLSQTTAQALYEGTEPPNPMDPDAPKPAVILATPLFHVTANNAMAQSSTFIGGKLVCMYKWDAAEALRIIEQEQISNFSAVPTMGRELVNHPDFNNTDTSSLTIVAGGGAPVQPDLIEKIRSTSEQIRPGQGYGLTEVCGVAAGGYGIFLSNRPTSTGMLSPIYDFKCIDEQGQALPPGETGEICFRSSQVISGYLNRPEASAETIVDGWLHTGDIGFVDEDRFVHLVDRAKDMVLRGGENVYCSEVEAAIYRHDQVSECVVFSVPDERLGEDVGAAVVLKAAGLDATAIRQHCKDKLAAYKIPRYIWILDQPLPRNASGKFVKKVLQESLELSRAQ